MVGFCGALDFPSRAVDFSNLKRMCGLHSGGCAFINREFGLLCDSVSETDDIMQPVTVRENNSLYTVAVIMDSAARGLEASTARAILEGYIEEGDSYLRRLDFSYALALYDGRCGELLICKGYKGDKPLFYTVRDGRVYFASSLRPLIRLYGGCVRVNKKILRDHINGTPKTIPEGLFRDISSVGSGCGVLCSVFGQSRISGEYVPHKAENVSAQALSNVRFTKKSNLRRILSEALFAFDYPQFDCYMPSVIPAVANTLGDKNERIFTVSCPLSEEFPEYATERMERIGRAWGVDIYPDARQEPVLGNRELKLMDKMLDCILDEMLTLPQSALCRIFDPSFIEDVYKEKSLTARIRKKGMLCQSQMWAECFNLVFE